MVKKATLTTIANDLGISVGTISRILNGKGKQFRISDVTIDKVLRYAKDNGYTPNLVAKGLRLSKTFMLGLMLPDIANPFFAQLGKEIERNAEKSGYSTIFVDCDENVEEEQKQLQMLLNRKVDGIIAAPVGDHKSHFEEAKKAKVPMVMVDRYFEGFDVPFFSTDNYAGAKSATHYLLDHGHKEIALIKGPGSMVTVQERLRGYKDALIERNVEPKADLIKGDSFGVETGIQSTLELFKGSIKPTAIFAMSNQLGLGVLEAARSLNLTIPQDLSLIVFDDLPYAAHIQPALTTVKQNMQDIGQHAASAILQLIDHPGSIIDPVLVVPRLIERSSVSRI